MEVAGIMNINDFTFLYRGMYSNANNALSSGCYIGLNPATLSNVPLAEYSLLSCFNGKNTYLMQVFVTMNTWKFYRRASSDGGASWSAWSAF